MRAALSSLFLFRPRRLLETPFDRYARVERAHSAQFSKEQKRRTGAAQRAAQREAKLSAWHDRVAGASLRLQASRERRGM